MLRIWNYGSSTQDNDNPGKTATPGSGYMIQVETLPSGTKHYFSDLVELGRFIEQHLLDVKAANKC